MHTVRLEFEDAVDLARTSDVHALNVDHDSQGAQREDTREVLCVETGGGTRAKVESLARLVGETAEVRKRVAIEVGAATDTVLESRDFG
ncbi:MAG: hypothetical protein K2Y21_09535 [Phycisphaerales bacterium]|nr:hypothetical protein [Phycisphaerales bacterium]